ncbi:P4HA [Acanthosepion pharaonis]|uniref:procollagen-proline 4-dioxygenase n=1 Tax=Acanthosepion pharaonis TaxID=158019 RepID=A0A812DC99_ACAPH|nr:P4HA [Sepia pharaonis]
MVKFYLITEQAAVAEALDANLGRYLGEGPSSAAATTTEPTNVVYAIGGTYFLRKRPLLLLDSLLLLVRQNTAFLFPLTHHTKKATFLSFFLVTSTFGPHLEDTTLRSGLLLALLCLGRQTHFGIVSSYSNFQDRISDQKLFTAMVDLQQALYAERDIAKKLKSYIIQEEERLKELKRLAEDYEDHSAHALENPDFYLGNPVNAFLLVKRFTLDWEKTFHLLKDNITNEVAATIDIKRQQLPDYEDLNGAAAALLRLQDTYQLDASEIARGELGGVKSVELTADECFELGRYAYNQQDFYHTIMWMQEALELEGQEHNKTVDRSLILDYLSFAMSMQGNARLALVLTNELLELVPDHQRAKNNKYYFEKIIAEEQASTGQQRGDTGEALLRNPRHIDEYRNSEEFYTYERLCRGEETQPIKDYHKLKCQYAWYGNPYLFYARVKEEEMHLDPWLVIYHDIVTDKEIDFIKDYARPKLNRATVQNSVTGKLETATYRISKSAWLKGEEHEIFEKINKRIQTVTNLTLSTAEELQVANYGIGGHYEPHFDFARKREKNAFEKIVGNRIATFLVYMSDVPSGGATVFPYLGLKLFPKKGTAAFWYNLQKNGDGIFNTRHAACPVLVGNKWVMNKWIHERGQEFRRPCSIYPDV